MGFREKTGITSDAIAKPGTMRTYTSGWPKNQKKCCQSTADPPAWVSKKCALRKRSSSSMICAAESGGMMMTINAATMSSIQT
jgi:hypothetical protein